MIIVLKNCPRVTLDVISIFEEFTLDRLELALSIEITLSKIICYNDIEFKNFKSY